MSAQDNLSPQQFYHGTPDERTWDTGSPRGIHVGTYEAARQALEAHIGTPETGDWDGTREYGKTPIVGNAVRLGYNSGLSCHDKGQPKHENARYNSGDPVPLDARPSIFPVQVTGPMAEGVRSDTQANGLIKRQISKGRAKTGYYYKNTAEDSGSLSAAVPSVDHLKRI